MQFDSSKSRRRARRIVRSVGVFTGYLTTKLMLAVRGTS